MSSYGTQPSFLPFFFLTIFPFFFLSFFFPSQKTEMGDPLSSKPHLVSRDPLASLHVVNHCLNSPIDCTSSSPPSLPFGDQEKDASGRSTPNHAVCGT